MEVVNIGVHTKVMNNQKGVPEFTDENKEVDIDVISSVLDMKNKIVLKSFVLYEDLTEGNMYDLLITQSMRDFETGETNSRYRERLSMCLTKIEIPSECANNGKHVTYVFESKTCIEKETDKLKELEVNIDKITKLTMEMISKDCEKQSLKDDFAKLKTEVHNINSIGEECTISGNEDNTFSISAKVEVKSSKNDKQLATLTGKIVDWKIKF